MEKDQQQIEVGYNWKPEEVFELTGKELELMLNYCNSVLNNVEAQRIVAIHELKKALDQKMIKGVEEGKISVLKNPN
jgi:hypothetical protein